ncbi:hypothetical protein BB559_005397 [Furculomyces boomerangus]|uniref:tRNA-splicing endonuclease subunit Sen15 domain-containing protein n=1 Tax=Furculomyces boomerangus TaxID=61424 RepID=A0A2T9Y8Z8_9FUNG|nr:hypothetical protein BB559_005397 [Furculomyces boomerangus]
MVTIIIQCSTNKILVQGYEKLEINVLDGQYRPFLLNELQNSVFVPTSSKETWDPKKFTLAIVGDDGTVVYYNLYNGFDPLPS